MKQATYKKSISIQAPAERVWLVLFKAPYRDEWASEFSEGLYVLGEYAVGNRITFGDKTGEGLISKVVICQPYNSMKLKYVGVLKEGKEDVGNREIADWHESSDVYALSEKDGDVTMLTIESTYPDREDFTVFPSLWENR